MAIVLLACATMLSSLHADHMATRALFERYGPWAEANPVIRQVGPEPYFGFWYLVTATVACKAEERGERWPVVAAVVLWAVQTRTVSAHIPLGTAIIWPALWFKVTF